MFRDIQVQILKRKTLLTKNDLGAEHRRRKKRELVDSSDDYEGETQEVTKKRRRRRRKFLDSIASDSSFTSDLDSTTTSAAGDGDSSSAESGSGSEASSTSGSSDVESHVSALDRLTHLKRQTTAGIKDADDLCLRNVFAIFALGVVLTKDNHSLTFADLVRFVGSDAISWTSSLQNVPSVMRLVQSDWNVLRPSEGVEHFKERCRMSRVGTYLRLGDVDLGSKGKTVRQVLERMLQNLSLPKCLSKIIHNAIRRTDLWQVKFSFPQTLTVASRSTEPVPSTDLRAMALLLFALKYLYGLDDIQERYRSDLIRKWNRDHPRMEPKFVFEDWMALSRERAFVMAKQCPDYRNCQKLFDVGEVALDDQTWIRRLRNIRESVQKRATDDQINRAFNQRNWCKSDRDNLQRASDKINSLFAKKFETALTNLDKLDLRFSKVPLHDFAKHYVNSGETEPSSKNPETLKNMKSLLSMYDQKVGLRSISADNVKVENIEVKPKLLVGQLDTMGYNPKGNPYIGNKSYSSTRPASDLGQDGDGEVYFNFRPLYWRSMFSIQSSGVMRMKHNYSDLMALKILNQCPESFSWILKYFSAVYDVRVTELFMELLLVEQEIAKQDQNFFGLVERSARTVNLVENVAKNLKTKLCL